MFRARCAVWLWGLALAGGLGATANRGQLIAQPGGEPGFRPLFNGRDLSGWHKNPEKIGHGTGGKWEVVKGAIEGEQDPPEIGRAHV